jgi:lipoprotein-releasing system permease protein
VAALIVVLSVMNGFVKEVRERMLAAVSHIEVTSYTGHVADVQTIMAQAKRNPEVVAGAPFVNAQGMFAQGDIVRGALVRGVDPALEPAVSDIARRISGGDISSLADGQFNVILGIELARALHVTVGDKVTLISPQGNVTPAGVVPRLRQFTVSGTFSSGHYEFDSTLAMIHLGDAQRLYRVAGPSGVRLRLKDAERAPQVAGEIASSLDAGLLVRDWSRQNPTYFAAVRAEKRMMFIILTLIVAVAAFNLVSTLVMTVTEKQADIAILRTLGASPRSVMTVFIVQGALIGVFGTLIGAGGGLLLANHLDVIVPAIERLLNVQFLPREVYFISSLPSDPRASDIVPITVISLVLSLVATLYPSWRASRTRPAEALRYD